jgi:hypothetical protein
MVVAIRIEAAPQARLELSLRRRHRRKFVGARRTLEVAARLDNLLVLHRENQPSPKARIRAPASARAF